MCDMIAKQLFPDKLTVLKVMYSTQADQADSSIHKLKSFKNTTFSPTLTLFAFHRNKKQYLDKFHKQKNVMHIRMQNNDSSDVSTIRPNYK